VKYDKELLEKAEEFAKDGQVSYAEANNLWQSALDGHGVTDIEKLSLEHTLKTLKYTDKARTFLREQLDSGKKTIVL
jgi:phosphoserine phosphatase